MPSGSASRETEIGPLLSCPITARRLGSPSAWKTRSILGFFPATLGLASELRGQLIEQRAPSLLPHFRTIGALKESSLMGADEIGPGSRLQELDRDQRRRDGLFTQAHRGREYDAPVRHDVVIVDVVGTRDALQRRTRLEAKTG